MPGDLLLAISIMLALSAALATGVTVLAKHHPRAVPLIALFAVVGLVANGKWMLDNLIFTKILPTANLIVYSNFAPIFAGLLAGALLATHIPLWRRIVLVVILAAITIDKGYEFLFAPPAQLGREQWIKGICKQTSNASCSAAAAATLLAQHGIAATEEEMAGLCLTKANGTSQLGIYRGLSIKTRDTPFKVAVLRIPFATFNSKPKIPSLLSVGLRPGKELDPRYQLVWGWLPGVKHSVVYIGPLPRANVAIGDPSVGEEQWPSKALEDLWYDEVIYLERR